MTTPSASRAAARAARKASSKIAGHQDHLRPKNTTQQGGPVVSTPIRRARLHRARRSRYVTEAHPLALQAAVGLALATLGSKAVHAQADSGPSAAESLETATVTGYRFLGEDTTGIAKLHRRSKRRRSRSACRTPPAAARPSFSALLAGRDDEPGAPHDHLRQLVAGTKDGHEMLAVAGAILPFESYARVALPCTTSIPWRSQFASFPRAAEPARTSAQGGG